MRFVKIEEGVPEEDGLYHCRVSYDGETIEKVFLMWSLNNWHSDVDMDENVQIVSWLKEDEQDEGWVPVAKVPPIHEEYGGSVSEWCIGRTKDGAILLSLVQYNHIDKAWYDNVSRYPEERISHYMPESKLPQPPQTQK